MKTQSELLQELATFVILGKELPVDFDLTIDAVLRVSPDGNMANYIRGHILKERLTDAYNKIEDNKHGHCFRLIGETKYGPYTQRLYSFIYQRQLSLVFFEEEEIELESSILVYGASSQLRRAVRDYILDVAISIPAITGGKD